MIDKSLARDYYLPVLPRNLSNYERNIMIRIAFLTLMALLALVSVKVNASTEALLVVESTTKAIMADVIKHREKFAADQAALEQYLIQTAMPHWDIRKMVQFMVGKANWLKATKQQRLELQQAFYQTLLRYFVWAFSKFTDQSIAFEKDLPAKAGRSLWIKSKVMSQILPTIPVDYRIRKDQQNTWKIIDVRVAGLSLLKSKRSEYLSIIKEQGIDALVAKMNEKNKAVLTSDYAKNAS